MSRPPIGLFRRSVLASAIAGLVFSPTAPVIGNPSGAEVIRGDVDFQSFGNELTITNTPGAIIQWQDFSIAQDEITRFQQEAANSAVLNRVVGGSVSEILGQLVSNGQVFLINPNGVVFGQDVTIDTAGFVASTLDMANEDFLAGDYLFQDGGNAGRIVNEGYLATRGGNVFFVAADIENSGVIHTEDGSLVLAAGERVRIRSLDTPDIEFEVASPENEIINLGALLADQGAVKAFAGTLTHSGEVRADSVTLGEDGSIVLFAQDALTLEAGSVVAASGDSGGDILVQSETGTVLAAGRIEAEGIGGEGGRIRLLGAQVGVVENGVVSADGRSGGGEILIGGNLKGGGPEPNADAVFVGADTNVTASATEAGDGGTVIAFGTDLLRMQGVLSARGGPEGGDGGFVETSARQGLELSTIPDVGAPLGRAGTWLIDPAGINVVQDGTTSFPAPTEEYGGIFTTNANTNDLEVGLIEAAIDNGSSVEIDTTGNPPVYGGIVWDALLDLTDNLGEPASASLRLLASDDVRFTANGAILDSNGILSNFDVEALGGLLLLNGSFLDLPVTDVNIADGQGATQFGFLGLLGGTLNAASLNLGFIEASAGNSTLQVSNAFVIDDITTFAAAGLDLGSSALTVTESMGLEGTITSGSITFDGTGGSLGGAGITTFDDTDISTSGGSFLVVSGDLLFDNDTDLTVGGTLQWSDGNVDMRGTSSIVVDGTFAIDLAADRIIDDVAGSPSVVINPIGTLTKTGVGLARLRVPTNVDGTAQINTGELSLGRGGTHAGTFNVAAGTTLTIFGGNNTSHVFNDTVTGAGTARFPAGPSAGTHSVSTGAIWDIANTTLTGGSVDFENIATTENLTIASTSTTSQLGGAGTLQVSNTFDWTHGDLGGSGVLQLLAGATGFIDDGAPKNILDGRTLQIDSSATLTWLDGDIDMSGNSRIDNAGTFASPLTGTRAIDTISGTPRFLNSGSFSDSGSASTIVDVALDNSGFVDTSGFELRFSRGGTSTGNFSTGPGAELRFSDADGLGHQLSGAIAGMGPIAFSNAGVTQIDGTYNALATIVDSGSVSFNVNASTNTLDITSGTLAVAGPANSLDVGFAFTQSGGIVAGDGTLVLDGTSSISGSATHSGSGTTLIPFDSVLTIDTSRTLTLDDSRVLQTTPSVETPGVVIIDGTGVLRLSGDSSVFNDGDLRITGSGDIQDGAGGTTGSQFFNGGRLIKNGAGDTSITTDLLVNFGAINVSAGRLLLSGDSEHVIGGSVTTAAPEDVVISNGTHLFIGGSIDALTLTGGSVDFSDDTQSAPLETYTVEDITQNGGAIGGDTDLFLTGTGLFSSGSQGGSGNTILASGSSATISGSVVLQDTRDLTIQNSADLLLTTASGVLNLSGSGTLTNDGTITFDGDGDIRDAVSIQTSTFVNNGTLTKSGGAGNPSATTIEADTVIIDGIINASVGILDIGNVNAGSVTYGATSTLNATPATYRIDGATHTFVEGATVNGGFLLASGGTVDVDDADGSGPFFALDLAAFQQTGGTLQGDGDLRLTGSVNSLSGGTQIGTGRTIIASGAGATVSGQISLNDTRSLEIDTGGNLLISTSGGVISLLGDNTIANAGTLTFDDDGDIRDPVSGASSAFVNTGTLTKSGGAGNPSVTTLEADTVIMDGTVNADAGVLVVGNLNAGIVDYRAGSTLNALPGTYRIDRALHTFLEGSSVTGGFDLAAGGTVDIDDSDDIAPFFALSVDSFTQTGGTLQGDGDLLLTGTSNTLSSGSQIGSGFTIVGSNADVTIDGTITLNETRTLEVASEGSALFTGNGAVLQLSGDNTLLNSGIISFDADGDIRDASSGATSVFVNDGTLGKTGGAGASAATTVEADLITVSGVVTALGGRLELGNANSGTVNYTATSTLDASPASYRIVRGTHTFEEGASAIGGFELSSGGTVVIDDDGITPTYALALSEFSHRGGVLEGDGDLLLTGTASIDSGSIMRGSGATIVAEDALLAVIGGSLTLDETRTLRTDAVSGGAVDGELSIQGNRSIILSGDSTLDNAGRIDITGEGDITDGSGGTVGSLLLNSGTLARTGTSGSSQLTVDQIESSGIIDLAGDLSVTRVLRLTDGATTTGNGFLALDASAELEVPTLATASVARLRQVSGDIRADGTLELDDAWNWTGSGDLLGGGTVLNTAGSTLTLSGTSTRQLQDSVALRNEGVIAWNDGSVVLNQGASIENTATLDINVSGNRQLDLGTTGPLTPSFVNSGALTMQGTGTFTIDVPYALGGAVAVTDGVLSLTRDGSLTTDVAIGESGITRFSGTGIVHDWNAGAGFSGDGLIELLSGSVDVAPGATVDVDSLRMNGSNTILGGAGTVRVNTDFEFVDGTLGDPSDTSGELVVLASANARFVGGLNKGVQGAYTLRNQGQLEFIDGSLELRDTAALVNEGTLRLTQFATGSPTGAASIFVGGISAPTLSSTGTIVKEGSADAFRFSVSGASIGGTVTVNEGALQFDRSATHSAAYTLAPAGIVDFNGETQTLASGASFTGDGALVISAADVDLANSLSVSNLGIDGFVDVTSANASQLTVTGDLVWANADLRGSAILSMAPGSTGVLEGSAKTLADTAQFFNSGTLAWTAGDITLNGTARFQNDGDLTADFASLARLRTTAGAPIGFINSSAGIFTLAAGSSNLIVDVPVTNAGQIFIDGGIFDTQATTDTTGSWTMAGGAELQLSGSSNLLGDGAGFLGAGLTILFGSDLVIGGLTSDSATVSNFIFDGNSITGPGTLSVTDSLRWDTGTLGSIAVNTRLELASGATGLFTGPTARQIESGTLRLAAGSDAVWESGDFQLSEGGSIEALGDLELRTTAAAITDLASGAAALVQNTGAIERIIPGTTTFDVAFDNDGTVTISDGILALNGSGTHDGAFIENAPGFIDFGVAPQTFNAASSFQSNQDFDFDGETIVFGGAFSAANVQVLNGADITFDGTYAATSTSIDLSTVDFNGISTTGGFSVSSGSVGGSGTLSVNGAATLDVAQLTQTGTTTFGGATTGTNVTLTGTGTTIAGMAGSFDPTVLALTEGTLQIEGPASIDTLQITGGTLDLATAGLTVATGLTQAGGAITGGAFDLNLDGVSNVLSGGSLGGDVTARLAVGPARADVIGAYEIIENAVFDSSGTLEIADAATLTLRDDARLVSQVGATINLTGSGAILDGANDPGFLGGSSLASFGTLSHGGGGAGTISVESFEASGTIIQGGFGSLAIADTGAGDAQLAANLSVLGGELRFDDAVAFSGDATVASATGAALRFPGGGTATNSLFTTIDPGVLDFGAAGFTVDNVTFAGDGQVLGDFSVAGALTTIDGDITFVDTSVSIDGALTINANVTTQGTVSFNGGPVTNTVGNILSVEGTADAGNALAIFEALDNQGTLLLTNSAAGTGASVRVNGALTSSGTIRSATGAGGGVRSIDATLQATGGLIDIETNTVFDNDLGGDFLLQGDTLIDVGDNAEVIVGLDGRTGRFELTSSGGVSLGTNASFTIVDASASGLVAFDWDGSGDIVGSGGTFDASETSLTLTGLDHTVDGAELIALDLFVDGGQSLNILGGFFDAQGNITLDGGTLRVANLDSTTALVTARNGAILELDGSATLADLVVQDSQITGIGDVFVNGNATLDNATIDRDGATSFDADVTGTGLILEDTGVALNAVSLLGPTTLDAIEINDGELSSGVLVDVGDVILSGGRLVIDDEIFANGFFDQSGGEVAGTGLVSITDGSFSGGTAAETVTLAIDGLADVTGPYTIGADATLQVAGTLDASGGVLDLQGDAFLDGTLTATDLLATGAVDVAPGGILALDGTSSLNTVSLNDARLEGSGTLTVNGAANLDAAVLEHIGSVDFLDAVNGTALTINDGAVRFAASAGLGTLILEGQSLTVDAGAFISTAFEQRGGELILTSADPIDDFVVSGTTTLTGGSLGGAGGLAFGGAASLNTLYSVNDTAEIVTFNSSVFTVDGAGAEIVLNDDAGIFHQGTLTLANGGSVTDGSNGAGFTTGSFIDNAASGIIVKSGTGTSVLGAENIDNAGEIRSANGTLEFEASELRSAGTLRNDAQMLLGAVTVLTDGASVLGNEISLGAGQVLSSEGAFALIERVAVEGGTLRSDGANELAIFESFAWSAGTVGGGGGTIDVLGGESSTINGPGTLDLGAGTLGIRSSAANPTVWSGGSIALSGDARLLVSGNLNATVADGAVILDAGALGNESVVVSPVGTFERAGSGTLAVDTFFDTEGTTRLSSGTLDLAGGGLASGEFDMAGGDLRITANGSGSVYNIASGATWTGSAGFTRVAGGTLIIVDTADVTIPNLAVDGGQLETFGDTTVSDRFEWTGGIIGIDSGNGGLLRVDSTAGGLIDGPGLTLRDSTLDIGSGSQNPTLWASGDINLEAGAQLFLSGALTSTGSSGAVDTSGIITGTEALTIGVGGTFGRDGTGTVDVSVPTTIDGQLTVDAGALAFTEFATFGGDANTLVNAPTLSFGGGGAAQGSTFTANDPGVIDFGPAFTLENVSLLGDGTITGGTLIASLSSVDGPLTFRDTNLVTGGGLAVNSVLTLEGRIDIDGAVTNNDTIVIQGVDDGGSPLDALVTMPSLNNLGTVRLTSVGANAGATLEVAGGFDNSGTIDLQPGSGGFRDILGALSMTDGDLLVFADGRLSGPGTFTIGGTSSLFVSDGLTFDIEKDASGGGGLLLTDNASMNIGIGGVVTLLNEGGIPAPAFTWDGDSTIEGPGLIDTDQFDVALGGGTLTLNGADLVATGFTVPEGTELVLRNDALLDVVGTTRIEGGTLRLTRGELVTTGALEIDGTGGGFASVILEEGDLTVPNGGYLESGEIVTGSETSVAFTGGLFEFRDDSTLSGDAFVDLDTAFAVPDAGTGFTLATSGRVGDVAIGGAGLLNLTGDLTVDGASSFAGTVDVDGGTLRVANESTGPAAFTVGTLSIRNGGILTFDGSEGSTLTVTANPLLVDAATIDVTSTGNTIDVTDVGLALGNGSNLDVFGSVAMLGGASDLVFTDSSAVLSDGALTLQSTGTFDSAGSTWGITNSSLEVQTADTRLNASTFTVDNDLGALLDFASPDVDWQTDTQFNLAPGTTLTANAITVSGNGVQALNGGFLRLDTLVVESETDFTTSSTVVADTNIQSSGGNMTFLGSLETPALTLFGGGVAIEDTATAGQLIVSSAILAGDGALAVGGPAQLDNAEFNQGGSVDFLDAVTGSGAQFTGIGSTSFAPTGFSLGTVQLDLGQVTTEGEGFVTDLTITDGSLVANDPIAVSGAFTMNGGVITGDDVITFGGASGTLAGGTLAGGTDLVVASGSTLDVTGGVTLAEEHLLLVDGTLLLSDDASLVTLEDNAGLTVRASGFIDLAADGDIVDGVNGTGFTEGSSIEIAGTLRKSGGIAGLSNLSADFFLTQANSLIEQNSGFLAVNSFATVAGNVTVDAATLSFTGGGESTDSTITLNNGGIADFGTFTFNNPTLLGDGTGTFIGDTGLLLIVNEPLSFTNTDIATTGTLRITELGSLTLAGTVNVDGDLTNEGLLTIFGSSDTGGAFVTLPSLDNLGSLILTSDGGTGSSPVLNVAGAFTSSGSIRVFEAGGGASLNGALELTGGTFDIEQDLVLDPGSAGGMVFGGNSVTTVSPDSFVIARVNDNAPDFVLGPGATLDLNCAASSCEFGISDQTAMGTGRFVLDGGTIQGSGLVDTFGAEFAVTGPGSFVEGRVATRDLTILEDARLDLRAGGNIATSGTTRVQGGNLTIDGATLSLGGPLELQGVGSNATLNVSDTTLNVDIGGFAAATAIGLGAGGTLTFGDGVFAFRDDSAISGEGFVRFDGASIDIDATTSAFVLGASAEASNQVFGGTGDMLVTDTLTLRGTNSFGGALRVENGSLVLPTTEVDEAMFDVANLSLANATLDLQTIGTSPQRSTLSVTTGGLVTTGGTSSIIGGIVASQDLTVAGGSTLTSASDLQVNGTLTVADGADATISIANASSILVDGGNASFDGTISANSIELAAGAATFAGTVDADDVSILGGTATFGGTLTSIDTLVSGGSASFAGTLESDTLVVAGGALQSAGLVSSFGTQLEGGSLTIDGGLEGFALEISGGQLLGEGDVNVGALFLSGGALGGSGLVTVIGEADFDGGAMNGSGTTVVTAGATLEPIVDSSLDDGRTLVLEGVRSLDALTLRSTSSGSLDLPGTLTVAPPSGFEANFVLENVTTTNSGTLRLESGPDAPLQAEILGGSFLNAGTFEALHTMNTDANGFADGPIGSLRFEGSALTNTGTFSVQDSSLQITASSADFTPSGTLLVRSTTTTSIADGANGSACCGFLAFNNNSTGRIAGTVDLDYLDVSRGADVLLETDLVLSGFEVSTYTFTTQPVPPAASSIIRGTADIEVQDSFFIVGGNLALDGTVTVNEGARFDIGLTGPESEFFSIDFPARVSGTTLRNESNGQPGSSFRNVINGDLILDEGATLENVGTLFLDTTYADRAARDAALARSNPVLQRSPVLLGISGDGSASIRNEGTLESTAGTPVQISDVALVNAGQVVLDAPALGLNSLVADSLTMTGGTLTVNGASSIASIEVVDQSAGTVAGDGIFAITGAATLAGGLHDGTGTTRIASTSTTTLSSIGFGTDRSLEVLGTLQFDDDAETPALDTLTVSTLALNGGTLAGTGAVTITDVATLGGTLAGTGLVTVAETATGTLGTQQLLAGSALVNAGALTFEDAAVDGAATALFTNRGSLTGTGPLELSASLVNAGSLNASALSLAPGATLLNSGTATVAGAFEAAGTIELADGTIIAAPLTLASTGVLSGNGTVNGQLVNGGLVSPGNSPGAITVDGDFVQTANGTLFIEIDGAATQAGTDFDALVVTGNATFDGTLQLETLEGFDGTLGSNFVPISFASGSGAFATVQQPTNADVVFDPVIGPTGVETTISALNGDTLEIDPANPPTPENEEEAREIADEIIAACPDQREEVAADNNTQRERENAEGEQGTRVEAPDERAAPPGTQGVGCVTS